MSSFKKYYSIPEYKEKHNKYMLTKVQCPCGTLTARCNMTKHLKTNKHMKWYENEGKELIEELDNEIQELSDEIDDKNEKLQNLKMAKKYKK